MGASNSKVEKKVAWFNDYVNTNLPKSCFVGKTVVITGTTSGTGYILAETCVERGAANVLLLNRPSSRAVESEKKLQDLATATAAAVVAANSPSDGVATIPTTTVVEAIDCDLQDLASVRQAISTIQSKYEAIDVLCNNAGVMALEDIATKDGYDVQSQTNHLSHFLLTKELFPLLKRAAELRGEARVVNHSSMVRFGSPLKVDYFEPNSGGKLGGNGGNSVFMNGARWERYHQTKLANAAYSYELSERFRKMSTDNGTLKAMCAAPGLSSTNLQLNTKANNGMSDFSMLFMKLSQSAKDGTLPLLAACFHPDAKNGEFYEPSKMGGIYGPPVQVKFDKNSLIEEQRVMLWTKSEEACGGPFSIP